MSPIYAGDAQAIADIAGAIGEAHEHSGQDGAPYAVVPEGWKLASLPVRWTPRPSHTVRLRDAASFTGYLAGLGHDSTVIYATLQPARFIAVMRENHLIDNSPEALNSWRDWRADFTVPPSREWNTWTGANCRPMGQVDFAQFLQANLPDITQPDGADLLALVLNFEASTSGAFVAAQRLHDGSATLNWRSDTSTGAVKVPEHIGLAIPVFENEAPRELLARLRYRIKDGALSLWYELVRPHKVQEVAFREVWDRIEKDTGRAVLLGTPE
jgi:uncharacterized protein YfdQ (DUF2303 family)